MWPKCRDGVNGSAAAGMVPYLVLLKHLDEGIGVGPATLLRLCAHIVGHAEALVAVLDKQPNVLLTLRQQHEQVACDLAQGARRHAQLLGRQPARHVLHLHTHSTHISGSNFIHLQQSQWKE